MEPKPIKRIIVGDPTDPDFEGSPEAFEEAMGQSATRESVLAWAKHHGLSVEFKYGKAPVRRVSDEEEGD